MLQIGRVRTADLYSPPIGWMDEGQGLGVQPLTFEPELFGQRRIGAVGHITAAWVMQCGEVDPDLVGAARLELDIEQACRLVGLQRVVVGHAGPAVFDNGELPVVPAVAVFQPSSAPHDPTAAPAPAGPLPAVRLS